MASGRNGAVLGSIRTLFDVGTSAGLEDAQLLERYLTGREEVAEAAFRALLARHGPMVLRVCREILRDDHDAEDAFQSTFLVLARRARSIRRRESLTSWLFGVARKVAGRARCDSARRRARERAAALSSTVEPGGGREPEDFAAMFEEIDRLPRAYREPLVLCYLDGMTYEAAAEHLRCPLGTLSIRMKRARERLRSRLARRGVVVPAGLLVAGHSARAADVPTALAGLAVRSAMGVKLGRAMASGLVPAAVASLSGRVLTSIRYRALGIGSIGIASLAIAAAASLAWKSADPPQAPSGGAPKPRPQGPRSWVKQHPSGLTVELVAVSEHPAGAVPFSGPVTWRKPDGSPLGAAPYTGAVPEAIARGEEQVHDLVLRVGNRPPGPPGPPTIRWEVTPSGFNTVPGICVADGKMIPDLTMISVAIGRDRPACTVRVGVASGGWKTEAKGEPKGIWTQSEGRVKAIFGKPGEVGGKVRLVVSHNELPDEVRILALDRGDRERTPASTSSVGVGGFRQWDVEFDLPLAEIREFRLQTRPFEWATFEDVALKPRGE